MAFSIVGNEIRDNARQRVVETCDSHTQALRVAKERVKAGGKRAMAVQPTAFAEVALDFDDASRFELPVDVDKARAQMLRQAARSAATDEAIAEIAAMPAKEIVRRNTKTITAKQMDVVFRHRGRMYPAGSWIVREDDGSVEALTAEAFELLEATPVVEDASADEAEQPADEKPEQPTKPKRKKKGGAR